MSVAINRERRLFFIAAAAFLITILLTVIIERYILIAIPFIFLFAYASWYQRELVFYILIASLPLSFEYQFSSILGTDIPDEFLMILVSFLFISSWLYKPALLSWSTISHPLLLVLFSMLCWTVLSVWFSDFQTISIKYLLAKSWYLGAFVLVPLIIFKNTRSIRLACLLLLTSMFVVVLVALLKHSKTGFSFASINDAVSPFFRNHVNYSAMLVCLLPVSAAFLWQSRKNKLFYVWSACLLIGLAALYFSYARGAWLALFVGLAAYWLLNKRLLFAVWVLTLVIIGSALFWLKKEDRYLSYAHDYKTTIFHKDFGEHLIATYKLKDVSTAERFYRWIAATRMIKDNPITGYGPNTFYNNYKSYAIPAYKTCVSDNKDRSTVHNYFLLTAVEQGIPGLIFLLLLIGTAIGYAQYLYHRLTDPFYKTVAQVVAVIFSMILTLNFLSDLIETDKIGSLFFLCIAMLVVADRNGSKVSKESNKSIA